MNHQLRRARNRVNRTKRDRIRPPDDLIPGQWYEMPDDGDFADDDTDLTPATASAPDAPSLQEATASHAGEGLMTVAEVCAYLSLSRSTVDRLAKSGELPGRMKIGGQVRYHRPTLEAWIMRAVTVATK